LSSDQRTAQRSFRSVLVLASVAAAACLPNHDLDRLNAGPGAGAATGGAVSGGTTGGGTAGASASGGATAGNSSGPAAGAGTAGSPNGGTAGSEISNGGATTGGQAAQSAGGNAQAGGTATGGVAGNTPLAGGGGVGGTASCGDTAGYANAPLPDVPLFSEGSPVTGSVDLAETATWEVAMNTQQQAYKVTTPTAIYFLHLASGSLLSLTDPSGVTQWIQYSYGGQPDRGIPMLGGCCSPPANGNPPLVPMTTAKDSAQSSSTHLHVDSSSADGKWRLSWDFYLTHATVTVEQAGADYGFSYKGTPGGPAVALNTDLWLNGQAKLNALTYAANMDLPYPEWVRFAEPASTGQSLFLVQHRDDCLSDLYQTRTPSSEKTVIFTYGNGKIPSTRRTRFSFGLVANSDADARINYVVSLMK